MIASHTLCDRHLIVLCVDVTVLNEMTCKCGQWCVSLTDFITTSVDFIDETPCVRR